MFKEVQSRLNNFKDTSKSSIMKFMERPEGLTLPLGMSNYLSVRVSKFYIDKTLFIKELLDSYDGASILVTRPRRFGKSLMLSTVHEFFEINEKIDKTKFFSDTAIWQTKYKEEAFKYPVIHITFSGCYGITTKIIIDKINGAIYDEFYRNLSEIKDKLNEDELKYYNYVTDFNLNESEYTFLIYRLSMILNRIYNKPVVLLIDEYDLPINRAYTAGVYDEAIDHIRSIFERSIKANPYLKFSLITGVLQVTKESLFSGLNNLVVCNILSSNFDEYFGFNESEVKEILDYYDFKGNFNDVLDWYDGYLIGEKKVFNPHSILNFVNKNFKLISYWDKTGNNQLLDKYVVSPSLKTIRFFEEITNGTYCPGKINLAINFKTLKDDFETMVTFLFFAGYLTVNKKNDDETYSLVIPNKELLEFYKEMIASNFKDDVNFDLLKVLSNDFINGKTDLIEEHLSSTLLSFSSFDLNCEKNYQMIILTMAIYLFSNYEVKSEQNMGLERSDILITPCAGQNNAFIFELKYVKEGSLRSLKSLANKAIKQIKEKEYYKGVLNKQVNKVTLYGFAFSQNKVKVTSEVIEAKTKL